ncbi:MAG: SIMPL domain-containing protein [Spirochaetia bacterium]
MNISRTYIAAALIVAAGFALAGAAVGAGFLYGRSSDRYVTVKGLAERETDSNLAIWPITFRITGDDLVELQKKIDEERDVVKSFLRQAGFEPEEISYSAPKITDTRTEQMYRERPVAEARYIAHVTVTTRSEKVELVKETMEKSARLVGMGIAVAAQNWETPTEFLFTALNDIKPQMIEAATKNAREAAEKFAQDSGSEVGKIRRASQGYFSISERDRNSPDKKVIRVVNTVEYFLVD